MENNLNNQQQFNQQPNQPPVQQFNGGYSPAPAGKPKKPIYKKWWFWVIIVLVLIGIIGSLGSDEDENNETNTTELVQKIENEGEKADVTEVKTTTETTTKETTTEKTTKAASLGERNALQKAESYLRMGGFSKKGLKDQLEFEGFTEDEIDYAIKNCDANWKEQCVDKAESYLQMGGFSRQSLKDQLEFEGFTDEQIEYALDKVGY